MKDEKDKVPQAQAEELSQKESDGQSCPIDTDGRLDFVERADLHMKGVGRNGVPDKEVISDGVAEILWRLLIVCQLGGIDFDPILRAVREKGNPIH